MESGADPTASSTPCPLAWANAVAVTESKPTGSTLNRVDVVCGPDPDGALITFDRIVDDPRVMSTRILAVAAGMSLVVDGQWMTNRALPVPAEEDEVPELPAPQPVTRTAAIAANRPSHRSGQAEYLRGFPRLMMDAVPFIG
jgi:hypothetical protein